MRAAVRSGETKDDQQPAGRALGFDLDPENLQGRPNREIPVSLNQTFEIGLDPMLAGAGHDLDITLHLGAVEPNGGGEAVAREVGLDQIAVGSAAVEAHLYRPRFLGQLKRTKLKPPVARQGVVSPEPEARSPDAQSTSAGCRERETLPMPGPVPVWTGSAGPTAVAP